MEYDLIIVNGWSRLIKNDIINSSSFGMIGLHAGHPPIGHGRAPIPWNIILNFKDIEVYTFKAKNKADDGDIIFKQTVEITPHENARILYEKIMYAGSKLIEKSINCIDKNGRVDVPNFSGLGSTFTNFFLSPNQANWKLREGQTKRGRGRWTLYPGDLSNLSEVSFYAGGP